MRWLVLVLVLEGILNPSGVLVSESAAEPGLKRGDPRKSPAPFQENPAAVGGLSFFFDREGKVPGGDEEGREDTDLLLAELQEEGGLELPLLEEVAPSKKKVRKKKKKKRSLYPFTVEEMELHTSWGWDDNVFKSADIFIPETGDNIEPQDDEFFRTRLHYSWDRYFSREDRISLDYYYYGRFYEDLSYGDRQRHTLIIEWRKRITPDHEVTTGLRGSRRLKTGTNRFGEKLRTDLDYYRTDLFVESLWKLSERDELTFEYRFVNWDYDEVSRKRSIDRWENRFRLEFDREYENGVGASLWGETRWRNYTEKLARDFNGRKVEGEIRQQHREFVGLRVERPLGDRIDIGLEVEYERLTDPFQDYYSYDRWNYRIDLDIQLTERLLLELQGKFYDRDYDKRRFLASRLPDLTGPRTYLDPLIDLYEDYRFEAELTYQWSENLELVGGYRLRWHRVNDPTEEYVGSHVYAGLTYYFKRRTPPRKKKTAPRSL